MSDSLFIRPVDVLFLRGNRLFSDAGHAEAQMPPWPSLFAGALRARIVLEQGAEPAYRAGRAPGGAVRRVVGASRREPGTFRLCRVALGGRATNGAIETLFPVPADLVVTRRDGDLNRASNAERALSAAGLVFTRRAGDVTATALEPVPLARLSDVRASSLLPRLPILHQAHRAKPVTGVWITKHGLEAHLAGKPVPLNELAESHALYDIDARLGIAMSEVTRSAEEGMIYTSDAVALRDDVGFCVEVSGAEDILPRAGLLRLGGDGRGASVSSPRIAWPQSTTSTAGFRIVMSTPGLFAGGWLPPGVEKRGGAYIFARGGLEAELVAAAIPRADVMSGWDLAAGAPKPAVKVVPAGAVYWFAVRSGDSREVLHLADEGWWLDGERSLDPESAARRAEGFNNIWVGAWAPQE